MSVSQSFREKNPVTIGAVGLVLIAALMVGAFRAQDLPLIGGGDSFSAHFAESAGLKKGDEVRLAGVRVGKVDDVTLDGAKVKVDFTLDTDADLGGAPNAAIKVKTLLGAMYVALEPAGSGSFEEGSTIPLERTTSPFAVVDAFSGLAENSDEIDTDQLADALGTLSDLTRNTPEEFRAALDGVSRLSATVASRDEQIGTLLQNLDDVAGVLDERDEDIVALMKDADVLFRALVARREAVHDLLVSTDTLATELTALVRQSRADLKPALTHLENVVRVLNKNEDNLDNSLRLMAPFYRVFANTLGTGPWFDTYIQNMPPVPEVG